MKKLGSVLLASAVTIVTFAGTAGAGESSVARYKADVAFVIPGIRWHTVDGQQQANIGNGNFVVTVRSSGVAMGINNVSLLTNNQLSLEGRRLNGITYMLLSNGNTGSASLGKAGASWEANEIAKLGAHNTYKTEWGYFGKWGISVRVYTSDGGSIYVGVVTS